MKIRRRFASGGLVSRLLAWLREALARPSREDDDLGDPFLPEPPRWGGDPAGPAVRPARITPDRARRPAGPARPPSSPGPRSSAHPLLGWVDQRFALLAAGIFVGTLLAGYLLAALVFFPAPIFASSRSVPRVIGLEEQAAKDRLAADGLRAGAVEREAHPTAASGLVVWQDPPPGVVAPEATEVRLSVSDGPRRIPVPDVAGYEAEHARLLIQSAGLRVGSTESAQAPTPRDVVVNTRPPAGSPVVPGGSVTLVVSVGAATIRVPSLDGLTLEEARLALETAGLTLGTWFGQTTSQRAPGEIFYQDPSPGTLSAPGTAVHVRVARGSR